MKGQSNLIKNTQSAQWGVVCYLFCSCSYVANIANNIDPDQTAPKSIVSMIKSSLKCTCIYAADVKEDIFRAKKTWLDKG